jgi:hypothetical protein
MAVIAKTDFSDLRDDFKNFLQSQTEFTDFDLTQSGLDQIINLMSYGIHVDSIQANVSNSEMFLDSAQLRKNVTSRAKMLMYTPKSVTSARSIIDIIVTDSDSSNLPNTLFLPKGTKFLTNKSSTETLSFMTTSSYIAQRIGNRYTFSSIPIYEGIFTNTTVAFDGDFIEIPNANVDTSTIEVYVQEDLNSVVYTKYEKMNRIFDAKSDSKVFYLETSFNDLYKIYFGDGVLGKVVPKNRSVIVTYLVSSGINGNDYKNFNFGKTPTVSDPINSAKFTINVKEKSSGGADLESIDSIKFNAPKYYSSQGIILNDYNANVIIPHNYPEIKSVNVWSGKNSGAFGTTYVSLNPYIDNLTQDRIDEIIAELESSRFVILTNLEYKAPEYIDLNINLNVYFDGTVSTDVIKTNLYDTILSYSENNIEDFKRKFISNKFINDITTSVNIQYDFSLNIISRIPIYVNTLDSYTFDFKNEIQSLKTNQFTYQGVSCFIKNSGSDLNLYYVSNGNLVKTIGTVDLSKGSGSFGQINIQAITDNTMEITALPKRESIFSEDYTILRILEKDINISYEVIK